MQLNLRLNFLTLRDLLCHSREDNDSFSLEKFKTGRYYHSVFDMSDEKQLRDRSIYEKFGKDQVRVQSNE